MMRDRRSIRKLGRDESGATVIVVAILTIVLFGAAALAIDVARMYGERRELQRTADLSAISGAMSLHAGETTAEAVGKFYVGENPTIHHPGSYNEAGGDLLVADMACTIDGLAVPLPCVRSTVVAPNFPFLLAPILSSDYRERAISAKATAVMGTGAASPATLVPWLLMDCARAKYGEDITLDDWNTSCDVGTDGGYKFSTDFVNGPFVKLYNTTKAAGSNFQGAAFDKAPDGCPATYDGLFTKSGAAEYYEFLEGTSGDVTACTVDKGARIYTKTGYMPEQTDTSLDVRNGEGIARCLAGGLAEFEKAITVINAATGLVRIDRPNPCLVAIPLVVHAKDKKTYPGIQTTDFPGGLLIEELQHQDPAARLADFDNGSHQMLVRRFAFFYITGRGTNDDTYRYKGLFMRGFDAHAEFTGGFCDPDDGICTATLVYEE